MLTPVSCNPFGHALAVQSLCLACCVWPLLCGCHCACNLSYTCHWPLRQGLGCHSTCQSCLCSKAYACAAIYTAFAIVLSSVLHDLSQMYEGYNIICRLHPHHHGSSSVQTHTATVPVLLGVNPNGGLDPLSSESCVAANMNQFFPADNSNEIILHIQVLHCEQH